MAKKRINPKTQRPCMITMIERNPKDCHISVDPKRNAEQQAPQASLKLTHYSQSGTQEGMANLTSSHTRATLGDVGQGE